MTSCPSEEELVLFVEDEIPEDQATVLADHVAACADCRRLIARSEAALRYALGGIADRERAAPVANRRVAWWWPVAAAAVLVATVTIALHAPNGTQVDPTEPTEARIATPRSLAVELDELLARVERIAAPAPPESDVALAALAAAEARIDLGMPTGAARLEDVIDRFPGTPEAREARARLASLGGAR